jgi:hypothetical protein
VSALDVRPVQPPRSGVWRAGADIQPEYEAARRGEARA